MHELSIALDLIELADEERRRHGGERVNAVHIRLGPLAGVVKEALIFSYGIASEDTALADSKLLVEDAPVVIYCPRCREERTLPLQTRLRCAVCGELEPSLLGGNELELVALELIP